MLEKIGHRPVRKLGQNFLIEGNIVRKSLELADIQSNDTIVEIGPGLGTLSRALIEAGANVYSIEKDKRLADYLQKEDSLQGERFHVMEGDALDFPLAGLPSEIENFKVVANLPYAISTPWMDSVLSGKLPQSMTLMLQKEAAQRYTAKEGGKQFGAISIFLQAAYEISDHHNVSSNCFYPKPEVASQLLLIRRKEFPYLFSEDAKQLIRELFQQRRKQVGVLLKNLESDLAREWLAHMELLQIDSKSRSEQIPLENWIALGMAKKKELDE